MIHYINNILHKFTNLRNSQESYISVLWSPMVSGSLFKDLRGYIMGLIHCTTLARCKKLSQLISKHVPPSYLQIKL